MDILQSLNESQRAAVEYYEGPSLVIAGAGSGKTRVLTHKIAYMLERGVAPWNILALTFTNKAAREMRERIETLVGSERATKLWMGTFHSIFARILRREAAHLGIGADFTIYDAADQKSLLKALVKEMGLEDKTYTQAVVSRRISEAKNALISAEAYAYDPRMVQKDQAARIPKLHEIYARYEARLRQANALDFDDLLFFTYRLLAEHKEVCLKYEDYFKYVLVDEYQDTNYAQHEILWLLTQHHRRICVVGDDAQSIYSFRGAKIDNILRFQQQYEGARLFKLERNYRSTQMIVNASGSVIARNREQIPKTLFSENPVGDKVELLPLLSDYEEAAVVAKRIGRWHAFDHLPYHSMAILYRTNTQNRLFEEALRREGIPYIIYGGMSFYQRKEIKDVVAYLRLAANPHDEESMRRIINVPARGIGATTLTRVFDVAGGRGVPPMKVVAHAQEYGVQVNKGIQQRLADFARLIYGFAEKAKTADVETLTREILAETHLAEMIFQGHEVEDITRQENLQELTNALSTFVSDRTEQGQPTGVREFLQEVSLVSDLDETPDKDKAAAERDHVTLMTVHAAKGLEFDVVFVVGLEEMLFPNQMAIDAGPKAIEEERRLMYVAMTRASRRLVLTCASQRMRFGKSEEMQRSRFLYEIDGQYMTVGSSYGAPRPRAMQPKPTHFTRFNIKPSAQPSGPVCGVKAGDKVVHTRFGRGQVVSIEGAGLDAKARVNFDDEGEKCLLLRFAKLTVIE